MRCKFCLMLMLTLLVSPLSHAAGWNFGEKIPVAPIAEPGVFQHLDATGRKSMAVSGNILAITWEDNRSGSPQAYVVFKVVDKKEFSKPQQISSGKSAFGPAILALRDDRFLVGWEQDSAVWVRLVSPQALGPALKIGGKDSMQVSLTTHDGQNIVTAWAQQTGKFSRIFTRALKIGPGDRIIPVGAAKAVDQKSPADDQSYPVVLTTKKGTVVVWEDRRNRHTVLLYSHAAPGGAFGAPQVLNEVVQKSELFGRGSGVTRVALDVYGDGHIAATWMDKRGAQTGYDIYAAFSQDGGRRFGANEMVQDSFADQVAQWHPAIAGDATGRIVAAWDDDRDDKSDIWLAWKSPGGWSTNVSPSPTSGDGDKTSPSIVFDARGNLHLIWLEREKEADPDRIMYAVGSNPDKP